MCPQKVCPACFMRIPARATECTTNGCHHVFTDGPSVAPIKRTYLTGTNPDFDDIETAAWMRHFHLN